MLDEVKARIHLLPARNAPVAAILRRKPSKCFHVMRWETLTDRVEYGSWFRGKLYPLRCDVSFDGEWMVYLALGAGGDTWNGVCRLPWLKTVAEGENCGTWGGGGYWDHPDRLLLNGWGRVKGVANLPFRTRPCQVGGDEEVLCRRLERDGWQRAGYFGQGRRKWTCRPTAGHPTLRMFYRGYLERGDAFEFTLDEFPLVLDQEVEWATWDSLGQLLVARAGGVEKYTLADLRSGQPSMRRCLEDLEPPPKPEPTAAPADVGRPTRL